MGLRLSGLATRGRASLKSSAGRRLRSPMQPKRSACWKYLDSMASRMEVGLGMAVMAHTRASIPRCG